MIKVEEDDSSDVEILDHPWSKTVPSCIKYFPEPITEKEKQVSRSPQNEQVSHPLAHLKSHFVEMGFSPELVDKVIQKNGENDADMLLETLFTCKNISEDCSLVTLSSTVDKEVGSETSGTMQKKRCLQEMGFTEDEISRAIDNFGPEVPICELADAIFANQIASAVAREEQKANQNGSGSLHNAEQARDSNEVAYEGYVNGSGSDSTDYDVNEFRKKRPKRSDFDGRTASNSYQKHRDRLVIREIDRRAWPSSYGGLNHSAEGSSVKVEMPDQVTPKFGKNIPFLLPKPPYLFFGIAANVSHETWKALSNFLYGIEPELVDTQSFSAIIRKEGYIHNLPMRKREHIHPMPPTALAEALPHTKKWWPSWDTRKKLGCISVESKEASSQCERLEKMLRSSLGMLDKEEILSKCRTMNLIWTGPNKLSPITPEEVEIVLGYPKRHTDIWGMSLDERLNVLTNCFQVDSLVYHLSVLKDLYPEGMKVLSVFTGIGGPELALHKLGIRLKYLVLVEPVASNREILRRWWHNSGQVGELIEVKDVREMSLTKLERIVKDIGGFDIVIGSNPCVQLPKDTDQQKTKLPKYTDQKKTILPKDTTRDGSKGVNLTSLNEFVRMYKQVRNKMIRD